MPTPLKLTLVEPSYTPFLGKASIIQVDKKGFQESNFKISMDTASSRVYLCHGFTLQESTYTNVASIGIQF
ncbi:hypothetical protein Aasi_0967 [Candidatus Amoebophilus asiaticus 5a2]|uniref:Uncharacterized protein n=1 Tax=Amoebophilus asiaticus (strain 5a2) TaxID=452471 RepID=B3ESX3_AMOA5|nr:hypothetical protein [Candidatus Amoebophilus asiaticus]ACE06325.1 hypothetical protein Aasi_0967 [Candidatus Amoebophilus asiaticus 5a2]